MPGGKVFFMEIKDVGKEDNTSVQQKHWLKTLKAYGFKAEVYSDAQKAIRAFERWVGRRPK